MKQSNFVFFSQKRWRRIKLLSLLAFFISGLFFYLAFLGFTKSPFAEMFAQKQINSIVDSISTANPGEIKINGQGSVLKLEQVDGKYSLTRSDLSKNNGKLVVLTFDDGPDPRYTEPILDILKQENIKASFFVVGQSAYKYPETLKRVASEGHIIGAHTFTHSDDEVRYYDNPTRMFYELDLTQRIIEQNTGVTTKAFRLPFWGTEGTLTLNNLVLTANATQRGYTIIGSTVDSDDWEARDPKFIVDRIKLQPQNTAVVLLHDGGGDRQNTIKALPEVISHYRSNGYRFATISDLVTTQKLNDTTTQKQNIFATAAFTTYDIYKKTPQILTKLFLLGLSIYSVHTVLVVSFALAHRLKERRNSSKRLRGKSLVSVIVPVFNEEKVISRTLQSILSSKYANFEVIVVNDGSKDTSSRMVKAFISANKTKNIRLFEQANKGKFAALNSGFSRASGEIVVCIDADTIISPSALKSFVKHFANPNIGAVAGNVKVGNQINYLTKLQELDYMMALNLERRAFSFLNSVFVVPGAIGAWRRSAVLLAGGFSGATLTEDGELGMRLKKLGFKIDFESRAVGYTEAPEKLVPLLRQRFRWTFGGLQTMWLHKDILFRPKYGVFGVLAFPYTVFIQLPNLALGPIFEFLAIPLAIFVSVELVLFMFVLMFVGRVTLFFVACFIGRESTKLAAYLLPYRFFYQFLWYFVFDLAILVALKGSFIAWNKMERTGKMNVGELVEPSVTYSEVRKL